jgi:hypothetical protein
MNRTTLAPSSGLSPFAISNAPAWENYNLQATQEAIRLQRWEDAYEELMSFFKDVTSRTPISDMQLACQCWRQLFIHLQAQKSTMLHQSGFEVLARFPLEEALSEEQLNLSLALAKWELDTATPKAGRESEICTAHCVYS